MVPHNQTGYNELSRLSAALKSNWTRSPAHSEVKMPDLSSCILNALDDAVAAEVGARLRQAAQNVPPGSGAPALPAHFEQSLQRLRTLHAQVKVIVGKTFGDAAGAAIPTNAVLSLTAPQDSPALKMLDASERTARPRKKRDAKRPKSAAKQAHRRGS
jgi:hypothetical protein